MKSGVACGLFLIFFKIYSQVPLLPKEGAFQSYHDFISGKTQISIDSVEQQMLKNIGGNVLSFPLRQYEEIWGIFYRGHLFLQRDNIQSTQLPLGVAPGRKHLLVTSKWDAAFVRIINYGKICLTTEKKFIKLPHRHDYEFSVITFRKLIKDDWELYRRFLTEKNKRLSIYKYIDLYNQRNTQILKNELVLSDN